MGKLIAIGGGPNGGDFDQDLEKVIRGYLHVKNPIVLFIPYASFEYEENYAQFKEIYEKMGCYVSLLVPGEEKKILEADLVYIGRGSTKDLIINLKENNTIKYIEQAYEEGVMIAGFSAGANLLFSYAGSQEESGFEIVEGLGLIKGCLCTHFNYDSRVESFIKVSANMELPLIGLEDHSMLVVEGNDVKLYTSHLQANGYRVIIRNGDVIKEEISRLKK